MEKTRKYPSASPLIWPLCNIPNALITRLTGSSLESRIPPAFDRSYISQQPPPHLEEGVVARCPLWPYSVGQQMKVSAARSYFVFCHFHSVLISYWRGCEWLFWDRPWCVDITVSCGVHFGTWKDQIWGWKIQGFNFWQLQQCFQTKKQACEDVGFRLANFRYVLILSGFHNSVTWGQLLLPHAVFVPKVWNWKKDLKVK